MYKNVIIKQGKKGFALLITVVVVSLILSISLGISNLTFKQTILSNLAKDSQISFYEADSVVECMLYYDIGIDVFSAVTDPTDAPDLYCGQAYFSVNTSLSDFDYYVYEQTNASPSLPCAGISIDKRVGSNGGKVIIQGKGYNVCADNNPRRVERAIQVEY